MRTTPANTKSSSPLLPVITATKKLWRQYHLTYEQTHYVAKAVRRALAIERPKTRKYVVARLSREEERRLIGTVKLSGYPVPFRRSVAYSQHDTTCYQSLQASSLPCGDH
jgi:hypothetical protein